MSEEEIVKKRGGPPGSGATVRVVTLSEKAAAEIKRRATIAGPRYRKEEADATASEIIERLAARQLLLITEDMRAALPWLVEIKRQCPNEIAQRGLDQLIAGLWVADLSDD